MKYVVAFVVGLATGALLFALLLYLNPLASRPIISPLSVVDGRTLEFAFHAGTAEALAITGSGPAETAEHPSGIQPLWEPTLRHTRILVTEFRNSRGQPAGLGIEFSTVAEETGLLNGVYPVASAWHVYLTGRGGLMVGQTENHWPLIRDVRLPARFSAADSWRGTWIGILTRGPNAIGTGRVAGGTGSLSGVDGEAVESVDARAWSAERGPVDVTGRLSLAFPESP